MPHDYQVATLDRIDLGWDDSPNPCVVRPGSAKDLLNVRFEHNRILKTKGYAEYGTPPTGAGTGYGLFDYVKYDGTQKFVWLVDVSGTAYLYYDNSGTWTKCDTDSENNPSSTVLDWYFLAC